MQAGRQRATLPLIRKFNEHSERLLKSALYVNGTPIFPFYSSCVPAPLLIKAAGYSGDEPASKKRKLAADPGNAAPIAYYEQIDLEDLHDVEAAAGIALEMQDRQRYFDGKMASIGEVEPPSVDIQAALRDPKVGLHDWARDLTEVGIPLSLVAGRLTDVIA
jgi:transcription initiation factor TFIIH subunit 1